MAKSKRTKSNERNDEIHVSVFKDIHIHFPGDVYLLAVWVAMSDRAKSTPTSQPHTALNGLASKFASAYGIDYSNPLDSDDVIVIFRRHGIKGNPWLRLEDEGEQPPTITLMERGPVLLGKTQGMVEQPQVLCRSVEADIMVPESEEKRGLIKNNIEKGF